MKATLNLNHPFWKTPERRAILDRIVQRSAAELELEIKDGILKSTPRGRLYQRGAITRAYSKKGAKLFETKINSVGKDVLIVGSRIHRASAPGQPPAKDSGGLLNSIRARKVRSMVSKVATNKIYAPVLDFGYQFPHKSKNSRIVGPVRNREIKPRPFFTSVAKKFQDKFKQNIQEAIAQVS